ncbi:uncharacterized protein LOC112351216 isoform X2 [Selaginella moellendorffii]|uniref:uncharacterized protein LOC112351216 isoform X2 n=1 Tax=Selaginella moellendorffii TaxID=88036 RepID=UPI000D1C8409|nr:uncharacterized protein LOC112351216 isoform X2 [Selaginella moellendorffii]|eukprot:XP_024544428.1 uncharacterized protein LOC112351216 isoform X2 [Selaginella moellendorffii]
MRTRSLPSLGLNEQTCKSRIWRIQVAAFGFVLLEAAVLCPMLGAFVSCPKGHRFKICASCGQQNKAGLVSHELTLLVHGACCAGATMGDHQARKETALFSEAGIDAAILVNASSLLPLFFLKERPGCMDAEGPDPAISQLTSLKDILIQQTYGPIALNSRETWMLVQKKKRNSSTYVGTQAFSYRLGSQSQLAEASASRQHGPPHHSIALHWRAYHETYHLLKLPGSP